MSRLNQSRGGAMAQRMQLIEKQSNRGAYEHLKSQQNAGEISRNALITEGYIRSEVALNVQNVLNFPINVGVAPAANNTERRLNTSDAFCATHIGFFLKPTGEDAAANAASRLVSYDDPAVNAGGNIYAFYNGAARIRVNQTVYFDRYDMTRFYRVGSAQAGLAVSDVALTGIYQANTWDSLNYGFSALVPFITFGGTDDNIVEVVLPANIDLSANEATAVFIARGLLIQNA